MKFLKEYKSIENDSNNITLLFTDIVGSSTLWSKYKEVMYNAIIEHDDQVNRIIKKYKNSFIVKTIGDAFMIAFTGKKSVLDALNFSIELLEDLQENPIKVGINKIEIRIGFAYGEVFKRVVNIQSNDLIDYFGNAVNTASRLESKVSTDSGFAFTLTKKIDDEQSKALLQAIKEKCRYEIITFENDCRFGVEEKVSRSGRLLTDLQRHKCENIDQLKGIQPSIKVFKCKLKKKK
jgi:hypothetical protein